MLLTDFFSKPPLSELQITFQSKETKMFLLTSIFGLLLLLWTVIRSKKPKNFPPGPLKLPVVGSIPFIQGSGATPSLILGISKQVKQTPQNGVSLSLENYWPPRNTLFTSATEIFLMFSQSKTKKEWTIIWNNCEVVISIRKAYF